MCPSATVPYLANGPSLRRLRGRAASRVCGSSVTIVCRNAGSAVSILTTSRVIILHAAIALPLGAAAFVDLPGRRHEYGTTWLAILVAGQVAAALLAIVTAGPFPRRLLALLSPLAALLAWLALGSAWWPANADGMPNVLAYLLFSCTVAAGGLAAARDGERVPRTIAAAMWAIDVVGLGIVAVSFAYRGFRVNGWLAHPRAIALVALVPLCWHLARWSRGHSWALVRAFAWIAAIVISLSRMATGAALVAVVTTLVLQARAQGRASWRRTGVLAAAVVLVPAAVATVEPFRERLLEQDRTPIWRRVAASALDSPLAGKGPGSSQSGPALRYWWSTPDRPRPATQPYEYGEYWAPHPHNEYLRVWHDLGLPGIALLLLAIGSWARVLYRASLADRTPTAAGELTIAGLLVLVVVAIAMLTDNPLVYPFVVAPAGVLVGAGLGASVRRPPARMPVVR